MPVSDKPYDYPTCPYCGSDNVGADGTAFYNPDTQDWELNGVYDGGYCHDCENTIKIFTWKELTP